MPQKQGVPFFIVCYSNCCASHQIIRKPTGVRSTKQEECIWNVFRVALLWNALPPCVLRGKRKCNFIYAHMKSMVLTVTVGTKIKNSNIMRKFLIPNSTNIGS